MENNIIEISRIALKEEFKHLPLMEIELIHLKCKPSDGEVYLFVDGDEFWQQKTLTYESECQDEF